MPTNLMDWLVFLVKIFLRGDKTLFDYLSIANFIENTITSKEEKIHFVIYGKLLDVWYRNNNVWISLKLLSLCFNVSKSS